MPRPATSCSAPSLPRPKSTASSPARRAGTSIERARDIGAAQILAVEPGRQALELAWARFFLSYDFLVMPATPSPALTRADCTPASRRRMLGLTAPVSLAGLPCLTLPVELPSGLTAGLQVVVNNPQSPVIAWVLEKGRYSSG